MRNYLSNIWNYVETSLLMITLSRYLNIFIIFITSFYFPTQVAPNDEAALPCVFKNEEDIITHLETDHYNNYVL